MSVQIQDYNGIDCTSLAEDLVLGMIPDDDLKKDFLIEETLEPGLIAKWGVQDGKPVCRIIEEDFDDKIAACAVLREAEMTYTERMNSAIQREYIITKGLRLELYSRGIDVDAIVQSGDRGNWAEIDYIIETEFPFLKTTNRSLILNRKSRRAKKAQDRRN